MTCAINYRKKVISDSLFAKAELVSVIKVVLAGVVAGMVVEGVVVVRVVLTQIEIV